MLEASDIVFPRIRLPDWTVTFVVALAAVGLPIAIVLYLVKFGRAEEGLAQLKRAEELDPLSLVIGVEVAELLDAVAVSEGLWREISPEQITGLAERLGDPELRHQELTALAESTPDGELAIAIYRGLGYQDLALTALERVAGDTLAVSQYVPAIMMTLGPDLARHPRAQAAPAALLEYSAAIGSTPHR